jgi:nucleotidyltransferase substrate binding protein (TIGR01987 family)
MKPDVIYALRKLKAASVRLDEAVAQAGSDLERDGAIQRFEFTFELFWKAVKILLDYEGFDCAGPRSCIKEGARRGLLEDGDDLLDMLEDRNKSSHVYDEKTAGEIFERIKGRYNGLIRRNVARCESYAAKNAGGQK